MAERTMVEALNLALDEALGSDPAVCLMGQDIGVNGGVFRVTRGLQERYGEDRVMDTPLVECGIIGTAVGMAIYGMKPVAEIQFSGFVMRAPYGGGIRAVEHHSESRESYWAHTPGLKVVIPSGPRNARALLAASIQDPDPVVFYEPKALYRAFREEVPDTPETMELGRADIVQDGEDVTIISYGAMMRPTIEAVDDLAELHGIQAELIDLLTISPMDTETLTTSVAKTGRCIIVHEGHQTCGVGAEIAARITSCDAFEYMLAPIRRLTAPDLPFPYFQVEQHFLPDPDDIIAAAKELMEWA
jgi:pyruvate dehydrogenase E1 component beta subunit